MDPLVEDFTARRPAGLEQAYALWSRVLYGVARHVLLDNARAEDCVHDALLRVWRNPNRFNGNRQMLKAYLAACVRNEAMATLRAQGRRDAREMKAFALSMPGDEQIPVLDHVEAQRVRDALALLPEEQRMPLQLAYYENKTQSQIAQYLGTPIGTIKSRIATAMRKLHGQLADLERSRS